MSSVWRRSEEKRGTDAFVKLPFTAPSDADFCQSPTVSVSNSNIYITRRSAQLNDLETNISWEEQEAVLILTYIFFINVLAEYVSCVLSSRVPVPLRL